MSVDVSCLCLTHGRPWLLAEAVESFRRQRLGTVTAELLIVNDCPEQPIGCDVPGVRVINLPEQVRDLSEKFNLGMAESRGKWVAFWDDDDISLPDRITDSVTRAGDTLAYRPTLCWNWGCGEIRYMGQPLLCAGMVDRAFSLEVGGCTFGEYNDRSLWDKIWPTRNVVQTTPLPHETHYIYRWAGIGWHESGAREMDSCVRAKQFHKAAVEDSRFVAGRVDVIPVWRQDYTGMVRLAIAQGKGAKRR